MQRANLKKTAVDFVAKSELGTKRVCPTTGRKFYDLGKDPIISPYTGMVVPVAPIVMSRAAARAKAATPEAVEEVAEEEADVEIISLEEADEDETATGKKGAEGSDDDLEIEEIPGAPGEDDTFLETDEDEEVDAAELIDGELPGDEET